MSDDTVTIPRKLFNEMREAIKESLGQIKLEDLSE